MPTTTYDKNYSIGRPFASIHDRDGWKEGNFVFNGGVVMIYHESKLVSLTMYVNGRGFYRTIKQ